MKKNYLLLASAAIMMAGCANDDFSGVSTTSSDETQAIAFNLKTTPVTRATLSGSDAATKLGNEFVVYGTKHTTAEDGTDTNDGIAFQNYTVKYQSGTAGTSSSNSANWEYVGVLPYNGTNAYDASKNVQGNVTPVATSQTIKYWDYSADKGYTFTAFSAPKIFADNAGGKVEKITTTAKESSATNGTVYEKGYKVTIPASATLDEIFFSDRLTVDKDNYGKPVTLTFRNFGTKVRVGFYETVPGYSVKIDRFYYDDDAKAAVTKYSDMNKSNGEDDKNFYAALQNVNPATTTGNVVNVTYGGEKDAIAENQVKINSGSSSQYQYTFTLGEGLIGETLGTAASSATYAASTTKGANNYSTVYPNLDNTTPMLIRCDYTLYAEDGSKEEIHVKNARVIVPANYCQWKSNYAYTYLFKISDKSNGTTGNVPTNPDDPSTGDKEGLFPITFDAVTITATTDQQETITTIASNSVTTYANGSDVTTTNSSEYKKGTDIYFVDESTASTGHDVLTVTGIDKEKAGYAYVYSLGENAFTEAQVIAKLTGTNVSGLTLGETTGASVVSSVPSASGNDLTFTNGAVSFTPSSKGYYAYVYCNTAYVAPVYTAVGEGSYDEATTYYYKNDDDFYYVASGINKDNFATYKSSLYTVNKDNAKDGVYDVKVVHVVE